MKKLFLTTSCLVVLGSSPVWAQADKPSTIVVRTIEYGRVLTVYTAHGGDQAEKQEFKFKLGVGYEEITAKYQQLIASYVDQGYGLQSMTSSDGSTRLNTFIFVKLPKP